MTSFTSLSLSAPAPKLTNKGFLPQVAGQHYFKALESTIGMFLAFRASRVLDDLALGIKGWNISLAFPGGKFFHSF